MGLSQSLRSLIVVWVSMEVQMGLDPRPATTWHAYLALVSLPVQRPTTVALSTASLAALTYVACGMEQRQRRGRVLALNGPGPRCGDVAPYQRP
jgi:hypothetical protein